MNLTPHFSLAGALSGKGAVFGFRSSPTMMEEEEGEEEEKAIQLSERVKRHPFWDQRHFWTSRFQEVILTLNLIIT